MIFEFPEILACPTPESWLGKVNPNIETLLIDHALCEKKAALSAISMLYSYAKYDKIIEHMPKLAREELKHFEMVTNIIRKRGFVYKPITPSNYAKSLHKHVAKEPNERFLDMLVLAAFIEARSYERFSVIIPYLDGELAQFYERLCYSERRHYLLYIDIAREYFSDKVDEKVSYFSLHEAQLITAKDNLFRMHSGVPHA
ncbi:MAG: tRNA-(ms[2]io[6]A)-hydroxylase [Pseudomonadota bacterium]|nr:tRNA-(ms[2]io[6]A)-hydroxylase [Pseudomonadota bacterium]